MKSKKPRKQRKANFSLPLHTRRKRLVAPLSGDLQTSHKRKRLPLRTGDTVKILRGKKRKTSSTVEILDLKKMKVYLKDTIKKKNDSSEVMQPIDASNLLITKLNDEDPRRFKK